MNLLKLRKAKNVTQQTVADSVMISRGAYTHYELGKREPDIKTICKLAEYFNVTTDYLLEYNIKDDKQYEMISLISTLTDEECDEIIKFIDYIISKRA